MNSTESAQPGRIVRFLRSPLFPIFMIVFVDVLGAAITIPVLPLYADGVFDASPTQVSWLIGTFFVAQMIGSPLLGRLSDRVGRRPVLILSQMGTCLALLLSGSAPLLGITSAPGWLMSLLGSASPALLVLFAARALDGLTGGNVSVAQGYLTDITEPSQRARGLGIINAAFGSGFIFGPAFGSLIAARFGPNVPFFVAACVSVITISLSIFLLPESLTPERRAKMAQEREVMAAISARAGAVEKGSIFDLVRLPGVALILMIAFGGQLAFFFFQTTFVLWMAAVPLAGHDTDYVQQTVGGIMTLVGIGGVATQLWLVGVLVRRWGEKALVIIGTALRGLAWAIIPLSPVLAISIMTAPLISMGAGLALPSLMALLTYAVPSERRGQAIGVAEAVQNIGRITAALLGGVLFERLAPGAPMLTAAGISAVTLAGCVALLTLPAVQGHGAVTPSASASFVLRPRRPAGGGQ